MLSEVEKRIRECYDAFLETVTEEDRDLWEIALLERCHAPLEDWEQSVPACFEDLASKLPRLAKRKEELRSGGDGAAAQAKLEEAYGWKFPYGFRDSARWLPLRAIVLLLEYCLLVEAQEDKPGACRGRPLFEKLPDREALKRIVENGAETPRKKKALALQLQGLCYRWSLRGEEEDWLLDLMKELLESAFLGGCGQAGWHLYELLWEHDRFGDWEPLDLLRKAAKKGSADAQLEIGRQFFVKVMGWDKELSVLGYCGEDISGEEALHWLEEALPDQIEAAVYLARLLLEGKGVPADEERAVRVLTAAAEGHYEGKAAFFYRSKCLRMLANCYAEGRGVPKDRRKALLYRKALVSECALSD